MAVALQALSGRPLVSRRPPEGRALVAAPGRLRPQPLRRPPIVAVAQPLRPMADPMLEHEHEQQQAAADLQAQLKGYWRLLRGAVAVLGSACGGSR